MTNHPLGGIAQGDSSNNKPREVMMRPKLICSAVGGLALVTTFGAVSAHAAAGDAGCVAVGGTSMSSCQFTSNGSAQSGYVAVSNGWSITHVDATGATVTDASGTKPAGGNFPFVAGALYTVTVSGNGTAGSVAGSPH